MVDFDHSAQAVVSEHTDRTDCGKLNGERRFTGYMEPTTIDGEFTGRSIHDQATQFRLRAENGVASHFEASLNQCCSPNGVLGDTLSQRRIASVEMCSDRTEHGSCRQLGYSANLPPTSRPNRKGDADGIKLEPSSSPGGLLVTCIAHRVPFFSESPLVGSWRRRSAAIPAVAGIGHRVASGDAGRIRDR